MWQQTLYPFVIIKYSWGLSGGVAGERGWQRRAAPGLASSSRQGRCPFSFIFWPVCLSRSKSYRSLSLGSRLRGGGSWCKLAHLAVGALGQCRLRGGPKAAWGVAEMSWGQWAPSALFAAVRLTASESNKTKNNRLDGLIVNFFSLLFHFGGRQAAPLLSVC